MDAMGILYLVAALMAVGAAIVGLNALVGRGPRGTVWMVAACLFSWGANLPVLFTTPDERTLSRGLDLFVAVLLLSGLIGAVLGILDALDRKKERQENALLTWFLWQPLPWALILCGNFYRLLSGGTIESTLLWRYCAGHPIEVIETLAFSVGLVILVLRLFDVVEQLSSLDRVVLEPIPANRQKITDCGRLLEQLKQLPRWVQETYLARRLWDAIAYIRRKESADDLDDQLRHLEELDQSRLNSGYAMIRIIIWAIPILGFLGTVIGITMAIANLSWQALEFSMTEVMAGLSVAFDTTALALALSIVLMLAKHGLERLDDRLLSAVDARTAAELIGRFEQSGLEGDANVMAIRRMSEEVLDAVGSLTTRQADVWKSTFEETNKQLAQVSQAAGKIVQDSLSASLHESLDRHAKLLNEGVQLHAERLNANTTQHVETLDRSSRDTVSHLREGLEKLAELLVESLERHGEVLSMSEKELAEENRRHLSEVEAALGEAMVVSADRQESLIKQSEHLLKEMQVALVEAAGATVRQQEQLVKQSDILLQVVGATGQIKQLETALNENLVTLRQGYHFEEMALNISAAIQLLCARLGHLPTGERPTSTAIHPSMVQAA